ncbi:MAG: TIGR03032 family protein [Halofilum sp. (in: g-proteobacteria)]|nr:TIGR03032 family protein [Halofilum sp. (in: g-proteobacteria)]
MERTQTPVRLELAPDPGFRDWIAAAGGALAISTYQAGMLVLVSWDGRQVRVLARHFDKPMGLDGDAGRLVLATRHDVTVFANAAALAPDYGRQRNSHYDALYLPRTTWHTGDLQAHEVQLGTDGAWVVNTRYSCLMHPSSAYSFEPAWAPPFISDLVPEDRCHLNGLALDEGRPAYATAMAETDSARAWREHRTDGGIVLDVNANRVLARGFAMPHSPRVHDGRLYVLDSGHGALCRVDRERGTVETVAELPGYTRGLTFVGGHALVGLSQIREKHIFGGLPVEEKRDQLRCGVAVVDLAAGQMTGLLECTAGATELFDLRFLPGLQRPNIIGNDRAEARQAVTEPRSSWWLLPREDEADGSGT